MKVKRGGYSDEDVNSSDFREALKKEVEEALAANPGGIIDQALQVLTARSKTSMANIRVRDHEDQLAINVMILSMRLADESRRVVHARIVTDDEEMFSLAAYDIVCDRLESQLKPDETFEIETLQVRVTPKYALYWCSTDDHTEDWFIVAKDEQDAAWMFEHLLTLQKDEATVEWICDVPAGAVTLIGDADEIEWPSAAILKACGGEISQTERGRVVTIGGKAFAEGTIEHMTTAEWLIYEGMVN